MGFQTGSNERIPFLEAILKAFLRDPMLETMFPMFPYHVPFNVALQKFKVALKKDRAPLKWPF